MIYLLITAIGAALLAVALAIPGDQFVLAFVAGGMIGIGLAAWWADRG